MLKLVTESVQRSFGSVQSSIGLDTEQQIPVLLPMLPTADQILPYLKRMDRSRTYSNSGPLCQELQSRLANIFKSGDSSVVCTSSGTSALIAAILASAGPATASRPLALIPGFTFAATAAAAERCGYQPYFVDIDANTWQVNADSLMEHPRLREVGLVIPVAPFGRPVRQEPWLQFSVKTGIPVVIDGAASFSLVSERPEDFFGEVPVAMSFHATKSFAVGEGGCVVWVNGKAERRLYQSINFGCYGSRLSVAPSANGKMSEYHAAVGLAELDSWANKSAALEVVTQLYGKAARASLLELVVYPATDFTYPLLRCQNRTETRALQDGLADAGIGSRLWYDKGMTVHPHFRSCQYDKLDKGTRLAVRLLGLPMAPDLTAKHIDRIVGAITELRKRRGSERYPG